MNYDTIVRRHKASRRAAAERWAARERAAALPLVIDVERNMQIRAKLPPLSDPIEDTPLHVIALWAAQDCRERGDKRGEERMEEEARRLAPPPAGPPWVEVDRETVLGDPGTMIRLSRSIRVF